VKRKNIFTKRENGNTAKMVGSGELIGCGSGFGTGALKA
jgi:hypothetical protein